MNTERIAEFKAATEFIAEAMASGHWNTTVAIEAFGGVMLRRFLLVAPKGRFQVGIIFRQRGNIPIQVDYTTRFYRSGGRVILLPGKQAADNALRSVSRLHGQKALVDVAQGQDRTVRYVFQGSSSGTVGYSGTVRYERHQQYGLPPRGQWAHLVPSHNIQSISTDLYQMDFKYQRSEGGWRSQCGRYLLCTRGVSDHFLFYGNHSGDRTLRVWCSNTQFPHAKKLEWNTETPWSPSHRDSLEGQPICLPYSVKDFLEEKGYANAPLWIKMRLL